MNRISRPAVLATTMLVALMACSSDSPRDRTTRLARPVRFSFQSFTTVYFENEVDRMLVVGDVTYLGSEAEESIRVFDTTMDEGPTSIAHISGIRPRAIAFSEDRLFVVERASSPLGLGLLGRSARLATFDVLDPTSPRSLESKDITDACALAAYAARAGVGAGNRVLIGAEGKQPSTLEIDASPDTSVVGLGWRGERLAAVSVHRGSLLEQPTARLTIFTGRRPVRAGTFSLPTGLIVDDCSTCLVELTTNEVWIGAGDRVLRIDISNPAEPKLLDSQAIRGLRSMMLFDSFLFTVADEVRIFRCEDLAECDVGFDIPPKAPRAIHVRDYTGYIATKQGLEVFSITTRRPEDPPDPAAVDSSP